jgi:hypothetical protein
MRKRSFREWLKLTLQHSTQRCAARLFRKRVRGLWSAEAKLPPDAEGGRTAVRPSPTLWERGQGVRATTDYFLRRRRPSKPARPAPSTTILAGSGTNTVKHWL